MSIEASIPPPASPGAPTRAAPARATAAAPAPAPAAAVDPVVRQLLDDATRRARFFQGPARWLRDHAPDDAALLEAYADALARELAPARDPDASPSDEAARPTWLIDLPRDRHHALAGGVAPADAVGADEVRMAVAVVAAAASVVSAVAAVVTAVVAVTNAVSSTPPAPPPPPKPK